jgi:hypothetical protein
MLTRRKKEKKKMKGATVSIFCQCCRTGERELASEKWWEGGGGTKHDEEQLYTSLESTARFSVDSRRGRGECHLPP